MPRLSQPDPVATKIGSRIKALREEQKLTQEKLAYEAGLRSKGHLSGIENGRLRPTLPTLVLLADRLGVELMDLMTFPETSPRHRLVDLTRSMPIGPINRLIRDVGG